MDDRQPQLDRMQKRQRARFKRMGLSVREMPDGLSLLVSLPLGPAPLEGIGGRLLPRRVVFSTVGANEIKCLRPRAFFGLPLIDVRRCADSASIEWTIRQAWRDHTKELRETQATLRELGLDVQSIAEDSALAFPLTGESNDVRVTMLRLGEAILPSVGPLSGLPLASPVDRVLEVSDRLDSASNLECTLSQRIGELAENYKQAAEAERIHGQKNAPLVLRPPPKTQSRGVGRQPKILIVGPQLSANETLGGEIEKQGIRTVRTVSEREALSALASMSPDLVLSEYTLGRSDGASFVQEMCGLPGINRIPVVLLDDKCHDGRRDIARAVGAVGYLKPPTNPKRFVKRLVQLIQEPGDRRFTRYDQRLAARLEGASKTCVVTQLGRGGVFISTPHAVELSTQMRGKMALPEIGRALVFEGEVRYCSESQGATRQGIGLRFFDMSEADEAALIEYLTNLESSR